MKGFITVQNLMEREINDVKTLLGVSELDMPVEDLVRLFRPFIVNRREDEKIKRQQYMIKVVKIDDLVFDEERKVFVLNELKDRHLTFISENRLFRKYGNYKIVTDKEVRTAFDFIVFDCKPQGHMDAEEAEFVLRHIIDNGFIDNTIFGEGRVYKPVMHSASQMRTGKHLFTCLDTNTVRKEMVYGSYIIEEKLLNFSKTESRVGLCLTTTIELKTKFNIQIINDPVVPLKNKEHWTFDGITLKKMRSDIELKPFDGMGFISPVAALKIALELKLVTPQEFTYFITHYTTLDDVRNNDKLLSIFNKIPSAFQIRRAGDKGLLVVWDLRKYGYTCDILMTESMHKYDPAFEAPMEIVMWNKPKEEVRAINYQFINAINITADTLIEMAKEALVDVQEVLSSPTAARAFLGMYNKMVGDEDSEGKYLVSKLTYILETNDKMLADSFVQAKLLNLLKKYIVGMAFGKIPVKGNFYYVISDPRYIFEPEKCLQSGQNYFNNNVGTYAGFRNPLVHKSEAVKLNMIADDDLWHLRDLIVLNPFNDTLPRAGGADVDGDKFYITADERIVAAVEDSLTLVYDAGREGLKEENNEENFKKHFIATSLPSNVGIITNYATIYRDYGLSYGVNTDPNVLIFRFLQGWEIDSVKTGFKPSIPENLVPTVVADWLVDNTNFQRATIEEYNFLDDNVDKVGKRYVYKSQSPMGQLYKFIKSYWIEQEKKVTKVNENLINYMLKNAGNIQPYLALFNDLRKYYAQDMVRVMAINDSEAREVAIRNIIERYEVIIDSLNLPANIVAPGLYYVTYINNIKNNRTSSFCWTVAFKYMLEYLSSYGNSYSLYVLPVDAEKVTIKNNMMYIDGNAYKFVEGFNEGEYEVVKFDDRAYIKVPVEVNAPVEEKHIAEDNLFIFNVVGYKYNGLTAEQVINEIKDGFTVQLLNDKLCVVTGRDIATIPNDHAIVGNAIVGKKLRVVDYVISKTGASIRLTATVVGDVEVFTSNDIANDNTDDVVTNVIDDTISYNDDFVIIDNNDVYNVNDMFVVNDNTINTVIELDNDVLNIVAKTAIWTDIRVLPNNVASYEIEIIDMNNCVINVAAKNGNIYAFNAIIDNNGNISIKHSFSNQPSREFMNWILSVALYNFVKVRLGK